MTRLQRLQRHKVVFAQEIEINSAADLIGDKVRQVAYRLRLRKEPMTEPEAGKNGINLVSSPPLLKAGCAVRRLKSKFPKPSW